MFASEPEPYAGDEGEVVDALAIVAREVGRFAKLALPVHPDIGGELAGELVAEPEPELDIVDAAADAELADLLDREIDLGSGLQDQVLRDKELVLALQAEETSPSFETKAAVSSSNM